MLMKTTLGSIKTEITRIVLAGWLISAALCQTSTQAQSTAFVSNLEQAGYSSGFCTPTITNSQQFKTGNNAEGYILESVQMPVFTSSSGPGDFVVSIHNDGGNAAGSQIAVLSGPNPVTDLATNSYTPSETIVLAPNTK